MPLERTLSAPEMSRLMDLLASGTTFGQIQKWLKSIGVSVRVRKDIGVLYELSKQQLTAGRSDTSLAEVVHPRKG